MNAWIEAKAIIGGRSRYCGSGNHTVAMATVFDKVLSVEINPQLVKAAELNLELNGATNVRCLCVNAQYFSVRRRSRARCRPQQYTRCLH